MTRGSFITFEGLDGSGKSTHLERLAAQLTAGGATVTVTREPGGTPLATAVREIFLDRRFEIDDGLIEALLVFASRRSHLLELIEPTLAAGGHVLCDRFTDSTWAYQGFARGLDPQIIGEIDRLATGNRRPDRTLLFDLAPEEARLRSSRDGADRLDAQSLEFYDRVRQGYLQLAEAEPGRFRLIDSSGAPDRTATAVHDAVADLFELPP